MDACGACFRDFETECERVDKACEWNAPKCVFAMCSDCMRTWVVLLSKRTCPGCIAPLSYASVRKEEESDRVMVAMTQRREEFSMVNPLTSEERERTREYVTVIRSSVRNGAGNTLPPTFDGRANEMRRVECNVMCVSISDVESHRHHAVGYENVFVECGVYRELEIYADFGNVEFESGCVVSNLRVWSMRGRVVMRNVQVSGECVAMGREVIVTHSRIAEFSVRARTEYVFLHDTVIDRAVVNMSVCELVRSNDLVVSSSRFPDGLSATIERGCARFMDVSVGKEYHSQVTVSDGNLNWSGKYPPANIYSINCFDHRAILHRLWVALHKKRVNMTVYCKVGDVKLLTM